MTRLIRSKSCGPVGRPGFNAAPAAASSFFVENEEDKDKDEEEEEEELESEDDSSNSNPVSTPFMSPCSKAGRAENQHQFAILDFVVAALKKSLVTCSVERDDVCSLDISWPTEVRHVSHVTFDRFNGFLGLPTELEPEVPKRVPSAR